MPFARPGFLQILIFMKSSKLSLTLSFVLLVLGLGFMNTSVSLSIIEILNSTFNAELDIFFRRSGFFCFGFTLICLSIMNLSYLPSLNLPDLLKARWSVFVLLSFFSMLLILTKQHVPIYDDYTGIFKFICQYRNSETFSEKLGLFWEPYFECRIPVAYLVVLLFSFLPGEAIPLNLMIVFNAIILLWIAVLLFKTIKNQQGILPYFPWFLLFLFHSEFMQSSVSPLSGICYNGSILFSVLALRSMSAEHPKGIYAAIVFGWLAMYTFGNGLLVVPLLLILSLRKFGRKKTILPFIILLLFSTVYFLNYHPQSQTESVFNLSYFLLFIPVFLGSAFQFFYSAYLPFLIGLGIITLYIYASFNGYDKKNPVIYYSLGFIILTAAMTAAFRTTESFEIALKLRYGIFSSFAIFCSLYMFLEIFSAKTSKKLMQRMSAVAIVYNLLAALFFYPETVLTIKHNREMLNVWLDTGKFEEVSAFYPSEIRPILECSQNLKLWNISERANLP